MSPADRPEQKIIDDDADLDTWYDKHVREITAQLAQQKAARKRKSGSAWMPTSQLAGFQGYKGE
jgi:hypothetical protein